MGRWGWGRIGRPKRIVTHSHNFIGIYIMAKVPNSWEGKRIRAMAVTAFTDAVPKIYTFAIFMDYKTWNAYVEEPLDDTLICPINPRSKHVVIGCNDRSGLEDHGISHSPSATR
jgi:hypothetical protein